MYFKVSLLFKNDSSHFFHCKFIDLLQTLYTYSDVGKDKDALLKPELIEVIKENFTRFHTRLENFISQNKTEETHVISKYFRDLLDQPVKHSFNRFRSVVKDVSQSLGKQIQFKLSGDQCSLNKEDLNLLHDAMIHLVRNSLDHGIEKPEIREKNNKDKEGRKNHCLSIDDDRLKITLQDDGGVSTLI